MNPGGSAEKLARMANQIAAFFRAYPEAEAVAGIRDHIEAFLSRRMRGDLEAALDDPGLDPLVVSAMKELAQRKPAMAPSPSS